LGLSKNKTKNRVLSKNTESGKLEFHHNHQVAVSVFLDHFKVAIWQTTFI